MKALAILAAIGIATAILPSLAQAQQLDVRFSCGHDGTEYGLKTFFADNGRIRINGTTIEEFDWESSVFRTSHGLECSMTEDDGLRAEFIGDDTRAAWRIMLDNPEQARNKRGYDLDHGFNCSVRIERIGDEVRINPSCPALCGSRQDFTEFSFDMKTGKCNYEN